MAGLTENDKNMLNYFWTQKGNLERWSSWEKRKEAIRKVRPEIVEAWERYKSAIRVLDALIDTDKL